MVHHLLGELVFSITYSQYVIEKYVGQIQTYLNK